MIDYRFSFIVNNFTPIISMNKILEMFKTDRNEFLVKLSSFNNSAREICQEELILKDNYLYISNKIKERWLDILFGKTEHIITYTKNQRQVMIYLMLFMQLEELSVFHFQDLLFVSKNTILKDIKKLRDHLSQYSIKIIYARKKGFYLTGKELQIRAIAYSFILSFFNENKSKRLLYSYLLKNNSNIHDKVRYYFSKIIEEYSLIVVPSRFEEMIYFISILLCRLKQNRGKLGIENQLLLEKLLMYEKAEKFLSHFKDLKNSKEELCYITVLFMICTQGDVKDPSLDFLMDCCSEIIYEIERLAVIHFDKFKKILLELFYHLVSAYFRIKYGLKITNVLIDEIKIQYTELFDLTQLSLYPFELLTKKAIPQEEVGYITLLFGGEILNQKEKGVKKSLKALVMCPSGISSSAIMQSQLKKLFPQLNFIHAASINEFYSKTFKEKEEIAMIFSSVPVKTSKTLYIIKPIMNQLEKNLLIRQVQEDFLSQDILVPSVNELLDSLIPYIELKKGVTRAQLYKLLQKKINKNLKAKVDDRPMLSELLTKDTVKIVNYQENWQSAIKLVAEPLREKHKIDKCYVNAMIQKVNHYGPFIHIGNGVALPHARPEEGVNELGMSLLKINQPVLLCNNQNHPINLFICLAAIDNENHLRALASLTKILSNKEKLNGLLDAETENDILNIIKGEDE